VLNLGGGLFTALAWGGAAVFGARASRSVGPLVAFAYSNAFAFGLVLVIALASAGLPSGTATDWAWVALVGIGIALALPLTFVAFTIGRLGIVSAVIATDGAMAALFAVLSGEELGALAAAGLVLAVVGIVLSVLQPAPARSVGPSRDRLAVLLALVAAVCFAATLVGASEAESVDPPWVVATGRGIAVVLATIPILLVTRAKLPRAGAPFVAANGACDVAGFLVFTAVSRDGLAVPAVLASQYALVPIFYGVVAFRERLTPLQWAGVALTLVGIALIAISNA
jgi:drug/metabolite transporter (DMT)-like permease